MPNPFTSFPDFPVNQLRRFFTSKKDREDVLLTPGPVLLRSNIQKILAQQMWHHRSPKFESLLKEVLATLKVVFQTQEPVLILNSSGTGAMEASLTNTLSPKEEILCVCAGKFGDRWRDIAKSLDLKTHSINVPLGQAVSAKQIEEELEKNPRIKALLLTACETSTATEQPVKEVSKALEKHPQVLFIVDGITGLGAMNLPMDKWGIDVLIAGSQKSFMIPTGLSFISLSNKAWEAYKKSACSKYYFDLQKEKTAQAKGQTAFSSNVSLIRALKASLHHIEKQGLQTCILRCQTLKESTHIFFKILGLKLFSSSPANSVTAIQIPKNLSAEEITSCLQRKHNIVIACGQGSLKNKLLRIGHLGPINNRDQLKALKTLALEIHKRDASLFNRTKWKKALYQANKRLTKYPNEKS